MVRDLKLSVVIPCYNEERGVRGVLERMPAVVDEVVVVDNNCTDRTAEVARSLGARVVEQRTPGYGAAYKAGLGSASGDVVITLDGDGTYPPEEIPLSDPDAMGWTNRLGNWVLTFVSGVLFRTPIRDSQSGMWVFRREALGRLHLTSDGMAFSEEIKLEALLNKLPFGEEHIPYGDRLGEVKLRKWKDGFDNLAFLVRKRLGWL